MTRGTLLIVTILSLLVLVPATLTFVFTGEDEDHVAESGPSFGTVAAEEETAPAKKGGGTSSRVPVFSGFEDPRYQKYDAIIARLVADFNRDPAKWTGGTAAQGEKVRGLTAAQVKAHMIQETGGGDVNSRAAWARDPLQVNVPGDWNPYKKYIGLRQPRRRNEGSLETNLKAGIMLLSRKGFGVSGQPAQNRPDGDFDGWETALQRYNGRSDKTATGQKYRDAYADRILLRAEDATRKTPIEIKTR